MKRPSMRETLRHNQASLDMYADSAGKPRLALYAPEPVRERKATGTNGDTRPLERDVLKAVWKYLAHHPKVAWISRFNSSAFQFEYGGKERWVRANYKRGMSDLLGQLKSGVLIAVEVKREGENLQPHQREFLNEVRAAKGVAFVARSVDDCVKELG